MSIAEQSPSTSVPAAAPPLWSESDLLTAIEAATKLRIEWEREERPAGGWYWAPFLEPDGASVALPEAAAIFLDQPLQTSVAVRAPDDTLWSVDVEAARARGMRGWQVLLWFRAAARG